jgi:hypothetical protein
MSMPTTYCVNPRPKSPPGFASLSQATIRRQNANAQIVVTRDKFILATLFMTLGTFYSYDVTSLSNWLSFLRNAISHSHSNPYFGL